MNLDPDCRIGRSALRVATALVTALAVLPVSAQTIDAREAYPVKPVRLIIGLAPGGASDTQARLFAQKLTESMGRPFVVDNRAGASGTIAYMAVAKSPPDGYTLIAAAAGHSTTPIFFPKIPYDPVRDFSPISLVVQAPFLLVVHPSIPARTARDFVALAQARPGMLDFGSAGLGTATGLAVEMFRIMARVKITHVPYKGISQATIDTMAGQVHAMFSNPLGSLPYVKTGRLRALAVSSARRSTVLPDLPTVAESGVPGYEAATWHGWLAPAGTPAAIVSRLNAELARAAKAPDVAGKLAADGGEPVGSTPEEFSRFLITDISRWRKVVKESGMSLDQ